MIMNMNYFVGLLMVGNRLRKATGQTIEFNTPHNSLLYLNNNTLNKRGKVLFLLMKMKFFYYN